MVAWIKGNIRVLLVSWMLFSFAWGVYQNYFQLFLRGLGATDFEVGLGYTVLFGSSMIGFLVGSAITDIYGRSLIVRRATFLVSLPPLLYTLVPDYKVALVVLAFEGFVHFYIPALFSLVQDSMPPRHAGKGYALTQMSWMVGTPAPLIGGYFYSIMGVQGLRISMLVAFVFVLAASFYRYFRLQETFRLANPQTSPMGALAGSLSTFVGSFKLLDRKTTYLLLSVITYNLGSMAALAVFTLYLNDFVPLPKEAIGIFISAAAVIGTIISYTAGSYMDKSGKIVAISSTLMLLTPVLSSIFLLTVNPALLFIAAVFAFGGVDWFLADYLKLRLFPVEQRVKLNTIFMVFLRLSWAMAGAIGGYLYGASIFYLFSFMSVAFTLTAMMWIKAVRLSERERKIPVAKSALTAAIPV